jgi:hypothetical protein
MGALFGSQIVRIGRPIGISIITSRDLVSVQAAVALAGGIAGGIAGEGERSALISIRIMPITEHGDEVDNLCSRRPYRQKSSRLVGGKEPTY